MNQDVRSRALAVFAVDGLAPHAWSNVSGYRYPEHQHPYDKVLICIEGSIVFHVADDDLSLRVGDRLDLPAGTPHSATVGPEGVTCLEASAEGE